MGSMCLDLFTLVIGFGAILFILLGLFSFVKFEVLEKIAETWGKGKFNEASTRLAVCFWIPGIIYTIILVLLVYFVQCRKRPESSPLSNQLNLDPSPLKTPIEMSKPEHTEELIDTSTPQKIESDPNIIGMKEVHVGSINV